MGSDAFERIKSSGALPSPDGVALRLLELTKDESISLEAISTVVESDPAISSRLLRLVNSPLAGMSRQVVSTTRAIALLGLRTVTSLALSFSLVKKYRKGSCEAFDYPRFWGEALARATATRHLALRLRNFPPDEAFTCGLLSKIGRLALATAYPERYDAALRVAQQDDANELRELEQAMFQVDHNELSAELMADWFMPDIFCQAVRRQDSLDNADPAPQGRTRFLAQMLHVSDLVACVLNRSTVYREDLCDLVIHANRLGITPDVYHEFFDSIAAEWRDAATIYQIDARRVPPLAEMYALARQRLETMTGAEESGPGSLALKERMDVREHVTHRAAGG